MSPDDLKAKLELLLEKHKQAGGKGSDRLARALVWEHQVRFEAAVEKLRRSALKVEYLAGLYVAADEIRELNNRNC